MKSIVLLLLTIVKITHLLGQDEVRTSGDNSPAVIAKNFSLTYGVRAESIEAILWVYEEEGYDVERRKRATEQILRDYSQSPEKKQKASEITEASRSKLGIATSPQITNALEWDLFARNHYLSTTGYNSPAVVAKGDVNIWYGISPKALRALATQLENNKTDFTQFETLLGEQVKKYEELKIELRTYGSQEEIYQQAEALLEDGQLEEAEQLIEADFEASMKRQAYRDYVYGKTKEDLLKYDDAAKGYLNAIQNDESNFIYHFHYALNENTLAHHNNAIRHYEMALGIDTLKSENDERIANLLSSLGVAWSSNGKYNKAIEYHEKALQINLQDFGENHPSVAREYSNLGSAWRAKGAYDKAIEYYEKALQIDLQDFGENHPNVAREYTNFGSAWQEKGAYDQAIEYYEKCQALFDHFFEPSHSYQKTTAESLSRATNSRGMELSSEKRYLETLGYFQKALKNAQRPNDYAFSLTCLKNIGSMQKQLGNFEEGLKSLDAGLHQAAHLNQELDQYIKYELTSEMLNNPEVQNEIANRRNLPLIRRIQYHKVSCLKWLKRDGEADALAQQLWQEGIVANDTRLLEDLRKEGYDFRE